MCLSDARKKFLEMHEWKKAFMQEHGEEEQDDWCLAAAQASLPSPFTLMRAEVSLI